MGRSPRRVALTLTGIYLLVGALWIVFSDQIASRVTSDPAQLTTIQTYKGWAFVLGSGVLIGFLVFRSLDRLREGELLYTSLFAQGLVGVYVVHRGHFLYANDRLAEILGHHPKEVVESVSVEDVVHPDDRDLVLENLALRERGVVDQMQYSFRVRRPDGETVHAEVRGRRLELGGEPAIIGVCLDRTEEVRLAEEVRRAQRFEAIGKLAGSVAHDFNNYLQAIKTPLELGLMDLEHDHPTHPQFQQARDAAGEAGYLTRQLLHFGRAEPLEREALELNDFVRDSEGMLKNLLPPEVALDLELAPGLPPALMDRSKLRQVLVNLVVNAGDAMPGGGRVVIRTGLVPDDSENLRRRGGLDPGPHLILEVEDTGTGMEPEVREKIFEPFFTTKTDGTGLGLSATFGIVKQSGGFVRVLSQPGEGSTFQVFAPADAPDADTPG